VLEEQNKEAHGKTVSTSAQISPNLPRRLARGQEQAKVGKRSERKDGVKQERKMKGQQ